MDVARRYSDAVAARDWDAAAALLDEGVEVVPPSGRPFGLAELRAAWSGPGLDHLVVELEGRHFEADGDAAAVMRAQQVFRWRESSTVAYTRPLRVHYEVDAGTIRRIEMTTEEVSDG